MLKHFRKFRKVYARKYFNDENHLIQNSLKLQKELNCSTVDASFLH